MTIAHMKLFDLPCHQQHEVPDCLRGLRLALLGLQPQQELRQEDVALAANDSLVLLWTNHSPVSWSLNQSQSSIYLTRLEVVQQSLGGC